EITSTFPSLGDVSTLVPMTSIITCSLPASIFWWAKNTQLGMTVLEAVILTIILSGHFFHSSFFRIGFCCISDPLAIFPGFLPGIQSFLIAGTVAFYYVPELIPVYRAKIVMPSF